MLYRECPQQGEFFNFTADPGDHLNRLHDQSFKQVRDKLIEQLAQRFPAAPQAGSELLAKW